MKGFYLLAGIAVMAVVGCSGCRNKSCCYNKDGAAEVETNKAKVLPADFYGTYTGTLPCADCGGIKTRLKINRDTTYELRSEYLGKKDAVFEESGVYNIVAEDVIELITPSSGYRTYYKILDGAIALSDSTGMITKGELAEYYILKKQ